MDQRQRNMRGRFERENMPLDRETGQPKPRKQKSLADVNRDVKRKWNKRQAELVPFDLIKEKMHEHKCNLHLVADDLDLRYYELGVLVDTKPDLKAILVEYRESVINEELLDIAVGNLRDELGLGFNKATTFTLDRLGSKRGYVTRTEKDVRVQKVEAPEVDLSKLTDEQFAELDRLMAAASNGAVVEGAVVEVEQGKPADSD